MTKKEYFGALRSIVENLEASKVTVDGNDLQVDDILTFIDHEVELLSKKRTPSENSKAKKEAAERAEKVYNALAEMTDPVTCSDLIKMTSDPDVGGYSTQRVRALITKLGNRVKSETVGKKTLFSVA